MGKGSRWCGDGGRAWPSEWRNIPRGSRAPAGLAAWAKCWGDDEADWVPFHIAAFVPACAGTTAYERPDHYGLRPISTMMRLGRPSICGPAEAEKPAMMASG